MKRRAQTPSPKSQAIVLPASVRAAILQHARAERPLECCGLLVGTPERIDETVATANVDPHPSRFRVDPEAHIDLNRRLRGTGRTVIGAYHSHPSTSAEPSSRDVDEAQALLVNLAKDMAAKGEITLTKNRADDELVY